MAAVNQPKVKKKVVKKKSLFAKMEKAFGLDKMFEEGVPVTYLPYVLFIAALAIIYIGNSHYADRTTRKINKLEQEVEDLRADYTTLKADYMYSGKQSEVAKKVKELGLEESLKPPYKIVVKEGEY